ncbi:hypothetical protein GCM10018793_51800 [Streptomyces sulfonofaciens]|uniref:Uncharacterized protein n=1 Tax=Streptomyces sulfonofaciens TaxID=68272 RepID=A0A919L5W6_9ACTN|nr:hypothetical protein [Streptomyces sulfonofaciens]GHH85107.1 hypothetical protein GCM10018793_51800 [Streptomyces sulfonofaciens]
MSAAPHLATVDLLCAREFPAEHGGSDLGRGGPGYHLAEWAAGGGPAGEAEDDAGCTARQAAEEQCEAERDGLTARLTERWGAPQVFGLGGVLLRAMEYGERIPEPWAYLSAHAPDVYLWRADGRWIALAVSRLDPSRPPALLAAVTEVDPP